MTPGHLDSGTLRRRIAAGGEFALLDVREARNFAAGHVLTACNVPLSRLELRIPDLVPRKATSIVLTDGGEGHSGRAARVLAAMGYTDLATHDGGAPAWRAAGHELFEGTNVPSKAFGEIVEIACATPALDAAEVKRRIDAGENPVILDTRPWDEYRDFCIPGGICCPNSELAYRVRDLVDDPETAIIVNCAGRTRSIIGAQTLRNVGVPNPVHALRNGTIGWEQAGLELERGASRRYGAVSGQARAWSLDRSHDLARQTGVGIIGLDELAACRDDAGTTLHLFDVRDPEEHASGSVPGAVPAQGTQLVQATDAWVAVRDAHLVLVDDTGVRARMTAHWLKQMAYPNVSVLDVDVREVAEPLPQPAGPEAPSMAPEALGADHAILDLSCSLAFLDGHPEGALWGLRSRLDEIIAGLPATRPVAVLDDEDGHLAALAVADLAGAGIDAVVLDGGMAAWTAAGLPVGTGCAGMLCAMDDLGEMPFDLADDPDAAGRRYIEWELQLPEQVERDGLLVFRPLVRG